ncbi:hypothetical protein COCVIDRAFT_43138 [Bipolaris victoriae FI3]|uniref:Uncharacterized protein n=1 Tax=Bipolaris victoriae (strain FI3) TaxID=930091 RepID=W7DXH7_BIPV3|nr:hypothetical protein COCVIDRAFT_43138 [Bipolaris victoriae FI3]
MALSRSQTAKLLPEGNVSATIFPPIRACIFDIDGLLINSKDIITLCTNRLLEKYGRPAFTRSIRFQSCEPLPSANKLLSDLSHTRNSSGDKIKLALASSKTKQLLDFFEPKQRILGDDAQLRKGRGKPAPNIYLIALMGMNALGDDWQLGEIDDGWAECISSLEEFNPQKYGLEIV